MQNAGPPGMQGPPSWTQGGPGPNWAAQNASSQTEARHKRKSYMNLFGRFPYDDDYRKGLTSTPGSPRSQAYAASNPAVQQRALLPPQHLHSQLPVGTAGAQAPPSGTRGLSVNAPGQGQTQPALGASTTALAAPARVQATTAATALVHLGPAARALPASALPRSPTASARSQQLYMPVGPYAEQYMRAYKKSPYQSIATHPSQDPLQGHPLLLSSSAALSNLSLLSSEPQHAEPAVASHNIAAVQTFAQPPADSPVAALVTAAPQYTASTEPQQKHTMRALPHPQTRSRVAALAEDDDFAVEQSAASAPALPAGGLFPAQSSTGASQARSVPSASEAVAHVGDAAQLGTMQQAPSAVQLYPTVALPRYLPYPEVAGMSPAVAERFPVIRHAPTEAVVPVAPIALGADSSRELITAYPDSAPSQSIQRPMFDSTVVPAPAESTLVNSQHPPLYTAGMQQSGQSQMSRGLVYPDQSPNLNVSQQYLQQLPQPYSDDSEQRSMQQYSQPHAHQHMQLYSLHNSKQHPQAPTAAAEYQYGQPIYLDAHGQHAPYHQQQQQQQPPSAHPQAYSDTHAQQQPRPSDNAQDYSDVCFAPLGAEDSFGGPGVSLPIHAEPAQEPQDDEEASDDGQYHTEHASQHSMTPDTVAAEADNESSGQSTAEPESSKRPPTSLSTHSQHAEPSIPSRPVRRPYAKAALESSLKFAPGQLTQLAQAPGTPTQHVNTPLMHPSNLAHYSITPAQSHDSTLGYSYHSTESSSQPGMHHAPPYVPAAGMHTADYVYAAQPSTNAVGLHYGQAPSAAAQLHPHGYPMLAAAHGLPDQAMLYAMPGQHVYGPGHTQSLTQGVLNNTQAYSVSQQQQQQQAMMQHQAAMYGLPQQQQLQQQQVQQQMHQVIMPHTGPESGMPHQQQQQETSVLSQQQGSTPNHASMCGVPQQQHETGLSSMYGMPQQQQQQHGTALTSMYGMPQQQHWQQQQQQSSMHNQAAFSGLLSQASVPSHSVSSVHAGQQATAALPHNLTAPTEPGTYTPFLSSSGYENICFAKTCQGASSWCCVCLKPTHWS